MDSLTQPSPAAAGEGGDMRVAIAGCGVVGGKRARSLGRHRLVACADVAPELARQLAGEHSCEAVA
ncbi:MAG TPA: hypothetical protein VIR57_17060, partial [Chloroflexota bacterium]